MDTTCKPEHSQKTKDEESTQKPQLERPEFMEPAPSPTKSNSPKRKLKTE